MNPDPETEELRLAQISGYGRSANKRSSPATNRSVSNTTGARNAPAISPKSCKTAR